jgi:Flp pilus assembly protein TadG
MRHLATPRRGNFAIITAIALMSILGAGALAVDTAYAFHARDQATYAAEAAALAGSLEIDGTEDGLDAAIEAAIALAAANTAGGQAVTLTEDDIAFGRWDADVRELVTDVDVDEIDAIRVIARAPLQGLLGPAAFGRAIDQVSGSSVALADSARASQVECFLPVAIPSCLIEGAGEDVQDLDMVLNPPGADNVGWGRPGANPSASWLKDQIRDCEADGAIAIGDQIRLNNGVVASAMSELADSIEASDTSWDSEVWGALPSQASKSAVARSAYGNTWEAPALVFEDDSYCDGSGKWNGTVELTGFVWVAVYDVVTSGPADGKTIKVRVDTTREHKVGTGSSGPDWGVQAAGGARLVR